MKLIFSRNSIVRAGVLSLILTVLPLPSQALLIKKGQDTLDKLTFAKKELRISQTLIDADFLPENVWGRAEINRFRSENGKAWHLIVDERTGRANLLDGGAIPFIPGPANKLRWASFLDSCKSPECIPLAKMESLAQDFLSRNSYIMRINPEYLILDHVGSVPIGNSIYLLRFQWLQGKVPVEGGSIFMIINNGNLIQVGLQDIGDSKLDPNPTISVDKAWEVLRAYVGGMNEKDEVLNKGTLAIIPITPRELDPDALKVPFGKMIDYVLVYKLAFRRLGVLGTWEALVDAHTGELIRFRDSNIYGHIQGGVYKTDAPQTEVTMPFPKADYGAGTYADTVGDFPGLAGTSTMTGLNTGSSGMSGGVAISDNCGAISLASSGVGLIDFGTSTGTDCTTPGFGGTGNTHAARTQYWNVTAIKMKGISYLPANHWLQEQLTDNVNIDEHCNAYWSPYSLDLNFFLAGDYTPWGSTTTYTCSNTGELPGVSLHEWGHGMDSNDGSGTGTDNIPIETRADWTAILQTHQSCVGNGFFINISPLPSSGLNCDGFGNPCTACTGVRDANFASHTTPTAWTPQNKGTVWGTLNCSDGYTGPCGWEDHCESGIATQALWDFVNRDLVGPPTNLDLVTAWQLEDRLFYTGMPTSTNMYTCTGTTTKTSNGCGTGSLYNVMRSIDDDGDGTANGTPHAAAIFAALNRHGIACGAAGDPGNQNQTSCPALTTPTPSAIASNHQVTLNWSNGGVSATRYFVLRNETSCDAGFTRIATVTAPTLTYTDSTVVNGQTYYYRIQAATANDSCVSAMSNCVTVAANLPANKDFFVPDWNTSAATYDNGTEPSTQGNFFTSSDVWNRATNSPGLPNTNGWYPTDPVQAGTGTSGDNYAFVRVRRNASGSAATVTAHFFVSPFGTGSSFTDAGTAAAPVLNFAVGDMMQTLSTGYMWHQDATSSTHACLAVQISTADDPYKAPSLLGRTPGPDDYLVREDNNKAQRNLDVSNNTFNFSGLDFALIHNSALYPRDIVLRFESPAAERLRKAQIEVVGGRILEFRSGGIVTLEHMQPGENRWIAILHQVPKGDPVPIHVFELDKGNPVNGFTVLAQAIPLTTVIRENLRNHVQVFNRFAAAFGTEAGRLEARAADKLLSQKEISESQYRIFMAKHRKAMKTIFDPLIRKGRMEDAFGVLKTLKVLSKAIGKNQVERVASEHRMLLNRIDSFATMLQKKQGDPSDILQMVRWQEALYRTRPLLQKLDCSERVVKASRAFINAYGQGKTEQYAALLRELIGSFRETADAFEKDCKAIEMATAAIERSMTSLTTLEKAHRDFLLTLQTVAGALHD